MGATTAIILLNLSTLLLNTAITTLQIRMLTKEMTKK